MFEFFLIFLLIFSCLFYGSFTFVPLAVIEIAVLGMVLSHVLESVYRGKTALIKADFFLYLLLFLGIGTLQLLPLPIGILKILSFHSAYLYQKFGPASPPSLLTISIYPYSTITEVFKIFSYFAVFFLVIHRVDTKKKIGLVINAIIFFGVFLSLFAIIQKYGYSSSLFGPFVYRNNLCGYLNMIIPLALGYALTDMPLSKRAIYFSAAGIMSLGVFLSASRGGILVFMLLLVFFIGLSRLKENLRNLIKNLFIWIFFAICLFLIFMDLRIILDRFNLLFQKDMNGVLGHGYAWMDIIRIWFNFPLFGSGLGTFANISSMYKSVPSQEIFVYAHNDFLQVFSETGIFGALALAGFFASYTYAVLRNWLQRHHTYSVGIVLGGLSAIFGVVVYSFLDFNLHSPAVAILFFVIMGLVYRTSGTSFGAMEDHEHRRSS